MKTNFLPELQMDLYGAMGDDGASLPTKTAIQDLIEEIQYWKEKAPVGSAFKDCLIILEGSATNKLEKEKEQIQEWYAKGWEESTKIGIEEAHKYQDLINQNK